MAVLVYADNSGGMVPNSALEAIYYASKVAQEKGTETIAVAIGTIDNSVLESLGNYGADKVLHYSDDKLKDFDSQSYTKVVSDAIGNTGADVIIFSHNYASKSIGPRLSAKLQAGMAVSVLELPKVDGDSLTVRRSVYAGKAFADVTISSTTKIIAVTPNAFSPEVTDKKATVESAGVDLTDADFGMKITATNKVTDKVSLTEATIVVSGGRGLKDASNWGMLQEMADMLGAATACSKPVADMGWRPHSEHVGQTGITVRPNLYFAIGISGAIQHLAGVNGSKVIVAINTDSEAPIFKAADYGIIGDAFEVVPKLNSAIKSLKG
ncbi:MAG: electron transfer flavoprotein subunit alpha [Bacteroidetes bacterium]|nr:MAG: electron transfer flavoprotein subunit alpha [Bacteroidota bacterium]